MLGRNQDEGATIPMAGRSDREAIHRRIAQLLRARRHFVVATICEVKGSCPQRPGAKMIVHHDGAFDFTIGGGAFEAEVIRDGLAAFGQDQPIQHEYKLTKPGLGMFCQGLVKVLFEPYRPRPQLLIFGGGHVGQALSKLAGTSRLFHVAVVDDRREYADRRRHAAADRVIQTDRSYIKGIPEIDEDTYIVIVTRCHATDKLLVKRLLQGGQAYLGLIGSEAKTRQFCRELTEEGIPPSLLKSLHAPIGVPIGGKDPAEVAVSILAEVIQVKNARVISRKLTSVAAKDRNL